MASEQARASYAHGASGTPLMGLTVGGLLADTIARHPQGDALVVPCQDVRWTYAELGRRVQDVAAGLVALGLVPGDRIGVWAPNMAEWVVLQFATAQAGLILVTINPAYRLSELELALNQVEVAALVLVPGFKSCTYLAMLADLIPELADAAPGKLSAKAVPSLRWVITLDGGDAAAPGTIAYADLTVRATEPARARVAELAGLRTGIIAGAPCPAELMKRIMAKMHMTQITIAYGMTETGPVSTQTAVDDPVARRVETVGRVLPHMEIKIVDRDGRIVPRGTPGELLTRGYCVMPKYWNDPDKTAAAIDEARWIASGDIAVLDDDGYFRIVGRINDMLIRGGENIFPREIEDFLCTHPAIDQVEVIGVPDPKNGEEVCAWIKLREGRSATEDEIRAFCQGKIAHFKIPRDIRFVETFPTTITGKVQKFVMRDIMAGDLAFADAG
ncbi:AMP-binding protein [Sulfitobacter sabulilitoris]|uniref:3-methylmercaptopropionyl-CoA ligase n=1 Tax=Sulfitobacter sabulilitoris TaxID=2562655 RepID=A0A5S3PIL5_9RHOB|nr:AMP-binding protein [Sulfitobacter sabulilitoris]TMM54224.1 hypothetical protein FDT80_01090 [Sulfitobacter sabulilitoris]